MLLFQLFSAISCIFRAYQNHFFENSFAAQVYQKQVYQLYIADTPACYFKSYTVCRISHQFDVSYSIGSVSMMNLTLLSTPDAFPLKVSYVHSSELSALIRSITVSRSSSTVSLSFLVPSSSNSEVPSASSFAPSASWCCTQRRGACKIEEEPSLLLFSQPSRLRKPLCLM